MNDFPDFLRKDETVKVERKEKIAIDIINCPTLKEV